MTFGTQALDYPTSNEPAGRLTGTDHIVRGVQVDRGGQHAARRARDGAEHLEAVAP